MGVVASRIVRACLTWFDNVRLQRRTAVIVTTNFPGMLDGAIMRRFRKVMFFDLPTVTVRWDCLLYTSPSPRD